MLQSCGTSSLRHATSSNSGFSAPSASALRKRQSPSNDSIVRVCEARFVVAAVNAVDNIARQSVTSSCGGGREFPWGGGGLAGESHQEVASNSPARHRRS